MSNLKETFISHSHGPEIFWKTNSGCYSMNVWITMQVEFPSYSLYAIKWGNWFGRINRNSNNNKFLQWLCLIYSASVLCIFRCSSSILNAKTLKQTQFSNLWEDSVIAESFIANHQTQIFLKLWLNMGILESSVKSLSERCSVEALLDSHALFI